MSANEIHLVMLLIGFGFALSYTWTKAWNKGYDEGYFGACDDVANKRIKVELQPVEDDYED